MTHTTPQDVTHRTERTERIAENAFLKLIARGAMVAVLPMCGWLISEVVSLRTSLSRAPDQLALVETRIGAKIDQVESRSVGRLSIAEDRLSAQSRRADAVDVRTEALSKEIAALTTQVAILVEQLRALLAASQPTVRPGQSR